MLAFLRGHTRGHSPSSLLAAAVFRGLFVGLISARDLPGPALQAGANASLDQFGPVLAERLMRVSGVFTALQG